MKTLLVLFRCAVAAGFLAAATAASAGVYSNTLGNSYWSGGSWNGNFTNGASGPVTNDASTVVMFTQSASTQNNTNDYPVVVLNQLVRVNAGNFTLWSSNGAGVLIFTNNGAAMPSVVNSAGTYTLTINQLINLSTTTTFRADTAYALTVKSNITGRGTLAVSNNAAGGSVVLTGSNSYTGGTAIQLGTLAVSHGFALGTGAVSIASGGTLQFNNSATITNLGGTISGAGAVVLANRPVLLWTSNSYSGGTVIAGASARALLANDHALGVGTIVFTANGAALSSTGATARTVANNLVISNNVVFGHVTDSGLLNLTGNANLADGSPTLTISSPVILAGVVSNGGFTKAGSGLLILSNAANAYAGGTTNSAGTLALGADYALGSGTLVMNGGVLRAADAAARALSNNVSFAANSVLGAAGSGDLTFQGAYADLGASARTLTISNATVTLANVLTNAGALVKSGPGTLVLAGANTYAGGTTNSAGTLALGADYALGSGTLVMNGGVLRAADAAARALSNNVSFAANSVLGAAGSGDLTFQGAYADLGASARTLTISNARVAVANSFTGVVELTKAGPGALALSGVNALGGLKLQSGDLRLEGGSTKILGAPAVVIGNTLGGDAALLIQGGSLAYSSNSTFFVGSGAGVTGTVIVAEGGALYLTNRSGLFTSSSTVFGEGGGFGSLIVSGGVVRTERTSDAGKLFVGGRQFSPGSGQMLIYGGSVDLSEALYVGHTDSTGLVLIAGGTLTVTNMAVLPAGVDYAKIGSGSGGMGTMVISNGGRFVSDLVAVGFPGTGLLLVSEGGTLELKRNNYLKLGIGGGTGAISNLHGGTIRFTTNAPDTSYTSANAFMSDSTLEFQGVDAAALNENAVVNFAHQGQNTLRLNSATNAAIAYAFTNGGRFAVLELAGVNPSWQGPSLLIGAGGELRISNATAGVNATLTNAGTIRAVNAHVTYSSPVVLGGGYLSDPSTNTFLSNLTVTSSGYLQGGAGDRFVFQRDLILQSTNTTQFDLSTAAIQFSSGSATNHVLNLTGGGATDLGSNWISVAQLATNFAVGRLTLSSGNSLQITGGAANAFYIGMLDLNGLGTNDLRDVLDLDVNLYYDPNAIGNEYLDGLIYDYAEWNGALIPLAIPEPSVFLALGAGLFLLALGRSRKRKD